jgi:hypothetical protein
MYSRAEQYNVIEKIRCKEGETKRVDCVFCGGKYTLTISRKDGSLVWNCYKASCTARGAKRIGYSLNAIKSKFDTSCTGCSPTCTEKRTQPLPDINSCVDNHESVLEYIRNNNCYNAYENNAVDITYDPAKHRVLFWMNDNQGAVGRSLNKNIKPKWLAYGNTSGVLTVGNKPTAIVVEDAASACAVYATGVYTGVALLGTNVSPLQRIQLSHYQRLIICLDKDASKKAIRVSRSLSGTVDATVCFIRDDFKYMSPTSIMETIDEGTRIGGHRL